MITLTASKTFTNMAMRETAEIEFGGMLKHENLICNEHRLKTYAASKTLIKKLKASS